MSAARAFSKSRSYVIPILSARAKISQSIQTDSTSHFPLTAFAVCAKHYPLSSALHRHQTLKRWPEMNAIAPRVSPE
jgi:hypothetical protein